MSAIILILLFGGRKELQEQYELTEVGQQPAAGADAGERSVPANKNIDLFGQAPAREPNSAVLTQIATIFVERFNSYSNQNNNSHIKDAAALSTDRMVNWVETQTVEQGSQYQGVVTQVYAATVDELFAARATVNVGAKVTTLSRDSSASEFKNGVVDLVKEGEEWKVDRFVWVD